MGNKIGRRRQVVVDERYTRPQGLYHHKDVDHKKLRKLILHSKLAPCFPGGDERAFDLEECPICFLFYPSLNRSRCCLKGICTECFLQMKPTHSNRTTQCPFCKTSNYAVEYRGVRTKEEKGMEQLEEQRVIEAQIRMRQQERRDEEERMQKAQDISSTTGLIGRAHIECEDVPICPLSGPSVQHVAHMEELIPSQESRDVPARRIPSYSRNDTFDLDLEDVMVMEAIWLSIQENGVSERNPTCGIGMSPEPPPTAPAYPVDIWPENTNLEVARSDTSYEVSSITAEAGSAASVVSLPGAASAVSARHGSFVPDNLEEQMMLAMACTMAGAQGQAPRA